MAGINKAIIVGRLGNDPEIRYSQQGAAIVNLSIATSEEWFDKTSGEKRERTQWHRIVVFGKLGEICEKFLAKGRQVYIEGRIQTRDYDKDGQKHYITEIVATTVEFLGSRQEGGSGGSSGGGFSPSQSQGFSGQPEPGQTGNIQEGGGSEPEDDIPF